MYWCTGCFLFPLRGLFLPCLDGAQHYRGPKFIARVMCHPTPKPQRGDTHQGGPLASIPLPGSLGTGLVKRAVCATRDMKGKEY